MQYWSGLPFPSPVDYILSDLSTKTRLSWVAPQAWLGFIELDKASVIRLTSFLWVWFQCVCPLMPSCNTYHLTWVFLPWAWGISSRLFQQSTAVAPYLGWRVSPHRCPSWPSTWESSSRPSCATTATAPWMWVDLPESCPWFWAWGGSSRPPPLASYTGWLLQTIAPDLGRVVAPPGRRPWPHTRGGSSWPFLRRHSLALSALPLTLDVG